jgi:glutaredoxin-related protein
MVLHKRILKEGKMIKIYGMPTCPYCDYVHEQIVGRENEFEYINIGENIRNMSIFTRMRDTNPVFDHCKDIGDVGVPAFVFEDGRVSLDPADAGLIATNPPYGERIEEKKNLPELYKTIGERFAALDSWSAFLITSYEDTERYIGRKADKNRKIYNGMMKTYFYQFLGPKPTGKSAGRRNGNGEQAPGDRPEKA